MNAIAHYTLDNPPRIGEIVCDIGSGPGVIVSVPNRDTATVLVVWLTGDNLPVTGQAEPARLLDLEPGEVW